MFLAIIDGTHVEVYKRQNFTLESTFKLSLNVMIVANPEGMVHALKADSPGSDNDMKVFKESKLYEALVDEVKES